MARRLIGSLIPLLTLAVGEVIAGLTLRFNIELLLVYPVLMIVIPGLMDLRGDVYGAIGYRLTTALHIGAAEPKLFTRFNMINILTGFTVSLIASLELCFMGLVLSYMLNLGSMDPVSLVFVVTASTIIVFLVLNPIVLASVIMLFKKGVDPSGFVAVVVTGVGDALTPLTLILVSLMYQAIPFIVKLLFVLGVLASLAISYLYLARIHEDKPVKENAVSSIIAASGSSLGGLFAAVSIEGLLSRVPEVLGVLPAFNALIGASMGHLGNKLNIEFHVKGSADTSRYRWESLVEAIATFISILAAYIVILATSAPGMFAVSTISITMSFILVYSLSTVTTFYLTTISFKHGWDPDNIVFPLMTTFTDFTGYLSTLLVLRLFI
ncbi:MAG: magnesium transporter [Desulfurococcus sp.]|uniref:magnesium transporter n=1 Tax=Desulfurococcus sp. TaxID=51678 RepID=UPI00315F00AB